MTTYEKRGFVKVYDEEGKLVSKTLKGEEVLEVADLFEDE
jgi:hypothetical protein